MTRLPLPEPPILVITDRKRATRTLPHVAREALEAGARWLSIREKDLPERERQVLVRACVAVASPYGALVGVHGAPDTAAGAVHLPRDGDVAAARAGMAADCIVGISAHDAEELEAASAAGADYATLSPVFPTESKPGRHALGLARFADLVAASPLPVLALGGVTAANAGRCVAAGAHGVAVICDVMTAPDVGAAVTGLIAAISNGEHTVR